MYTEQDYKEISQRLRKYIIITVIISIALIVGFSVLISMRIEAAASVVSCVLWAEICMMLGMFVIPAFRYWQFLRDMKEGLGRELAGSIVEISEKEELQDGVRVFPVRILLAEENDERIVYLNVSKKDQMPGQDANVRLSCYGRHIKEAVLV